MCAYALLLIDSLTSPLGMCGVSVSHYMQDKLMEISNELNSRFNKMSGWMKVDDGSRRSSSSIEIPRADGRGGGGGGSRSSPLLVLHAGGGGGRGSGEGRVKKKTGTSLKKSSTSISSAAATKARASPIRRPVVAPSKSSSSRHALDDDFLLSGGAAPRVLSARPTSAIRASDRQSFGQKKVATRLKGAQEKSTAARSSLIAERKRLIRNWNAKD